MFVRIITFLTIIHLISARTCSSKRATVPTVPTYDNATLKDILKLLDQLGTVKRKFTPLIGTMEKHLQENLRMERIEMEKSLENFKTDFTNETIGTKHTKKGCTVSCKYFEHICTNQNQTTTSTTEQPTTPSIRTIKPATTNTTFTTPTAGSITTIKPTTISARTNSMAKTKPTTTSTSTTSTTTTSTTTTSTTTTKPTTTSTTTTSTTTTKPTTTSPTTTSTTTTSTTTTKPTTTSPTTTSTTTTSTTTTKPTTTSPTTTSTTTTSTTTTKPTTTSPTTTSITTTSTTTTKPTTTSTTTTSTTTTKPTTNSPTTSSTTTTSPTTTRWTKTEPVFNKEKGCAKSVEKWHGSDVYAIKDPEFKFGNPLKIYCLQNHNKEIDGDDDRPWLIIQRRYNGSTNFYRYFDAYGSGFGYKVGEYFLGLYWIHIIVSQKKYVLWIQLEDWAGATRYAKYSDFSIGNVYENYVLKSLGNYSGNAGDSLSDHLNQQWTTFNKDNDNNPEIDCAKKHAGAWWYGKTKSSSCADSNLNGKYFVGRIPPTQQGIFWRTWRGYDYSYKSVHMAIRPLNWWD